MFECQTHLTQTRRRSFSQSMILTVLLRLFGYCAARVLLKFERLEAF